MIPGLYPLGIAPPAALLAGDSGIVWPTRLYLGSEDFVGRGSDADPYRYYRGCLARPLELRRQAWGEQRLAGAAPASGETEIVNADGWFDDLLASASVDGRSVVVKAVPRGGRLDDARLVARLTADQVEFDERRLRILLRPSVDLGQKPLQARIYAGTGGLEGGESLTGKPMPVALGYADGVTPDYLGVIGGRHTLRFAGHRIRDVTALFERGVAYDWVAGDPGGGQYSVDAAEGTVTVGGAPESLTSFTGDVEGYVDADGVFPTSTAALIQALLLEFGGLRNSGLDSYAFATLQSAEPAPVGAWFGSERASLGEAIQVLLDGVVAWGDFDRQGRYTLGLLKEPGGVIRAVFDPANVIRLEHPRAALLDPPPWRNVVGWRRNHTVTTDVAPGASEERRAFMAAEWREAAAADVALPERHPTSQELFTPGTYRNKADAQARAQALLKLLPGKRIRRIVSRNVSPELDIGQTVELRWPRFGIGTRLGTVLGVALDLARNETELDILA